MIRVLIAFMTVILLGGCAEEGCADSVAWNYSPSATKDDGSCLYIKGCTDLDALNYNPEATEHSYDCEYLGSAIFYTSSQEDPDCGLIRISMDGTHVGEISHHTPSDSLDCDHTGGVTIEMEPGEYDYIAHSEWGCKWYGTVVINSAQCTLQQIEP